MNIVTLVSKKTVHGISEVASDLHHECCIGIRSDPGDLDPACGQLDEEQDVVGIQAAWSPHFNREEVCGRKHVPVGAKEVTPLCFLASLRGWDYAVFFEDVNDSSSADRVANIVESAQDTSVAPRRVLVSETENEFPKNIEACIASDLAPWHSSGWLPSSAQPLAMEVHFCPVPDVQSYLQGSLRGE